MSPYISGFLIFLIISLFLGAFFSLLYSDKLKLNDESLDKQPLFWFAVLSPIVLFLIFGVVIWKDYIPDLSKAGLDKFAEISKFPLAVLALSPIFGVIVSNIHRTIQSASQAKRTDKQIRIAEEQFNIVKIKNNQDLFYSHQKYVIEKINEINFIISHDSLRNNKYLSKYFNAEFLVDNIEKDSSEYVVKNKTKLYTKMFINNKSGDIFDVKLSEQFLIKLKFNINFLNRWLNEFCLEFKHIERIDMILFYVEDHNVNLELYFMDLLLNIKDMEEFLELNSKVGEILIDDLINNCSYIFKYSNMKKENIILSELDYFKYLEQSYALIITINKLYSIIVTLGKVIDEVYDIIYSDSACNAVEKHELIPMLENNLEQWIDSRLAIFIIELKRLNEY